MDNDSLILKKFIEIVIMNLIRYIKYLFWTGSTINARIYYALLTRKRILVEGILFALIELLKGAKSILLYFIWRVGR